MLRRTGARWVAALVGAAAAVAAAPASAVVSEARLIDGPSANLVGEPQAAMSEDGTGGVVYLKRVDGRDHVFVSRFEDGVWSSPQRVDVGQNFDSSWPRIAAGDNGRLLVTWVQEFGIGSDRMYSATLDPGAGGFQSPVPVDFDVNEATSTHPDLAMSRGGLAYLVYNVVTDTDPGNPAGYVGLDVRLARYSNRLWTPVGSRLDRNSSVPMPLPTDDIAPEVGISFEGQAVAAWVEPDDEFVDRVYARRIFGGQTGIPLQASPSSFNEKPLRGRVTGLSLDVSGFGQATVAFRQEPGQTGALDATRIMTAFLPETFVEGAGEFFPAQLADDGARGGVGDPSVASDPTGNYRAAFASGNATLLGLGDGFSSFAVERIDTGASGVEPEPEVDLAESGAAAVAWNELRASGGFIAVQERRADGVNEATALSAPAGGVAGPPALGGSGLGDAIVSWSQGSGAATQLAAAVIDAPPDPFLVFVPDGYQRKKKVPIAWDPSPSAIGDVTYSVSIDDEPVVDGVTALKAKLDRRDVEDGRHRLQVFAIDSAGQETGSLTGRLLVDRSAPEIDLDRRGRVVKVEIDDGTRAESSGLRNGRVDYGDGEADRPKGKSPTSARERHRFARPGRYRIRVRVADKAGNKVSEKFSVRIR